MPYKDKELAKAYRKRTQGPYMKKYRAANKEKFTNYYREQSRKRRANKETAKHDYQVAKKRESYKIGAAITNEKAKLKHAAMTDDYIIYSMTKRGTIAKEIVNKELIEIHRRMLMIKRKLKSIKNDNISNKQR
ncbi:MAG: hypothetical protein V4547_09620 [Bacteroidota bacterium]